MNVEEVITRIETYKNLSTVILSHYDGTTEIKWTIKELDPEVIDKICDHYNVKWFKCQKVVAAIMYGEGWHITLFSIPVEVKETVEFVLSN